MFFGGRSAIGRSVLAVIVVLLVVLVAVVAVASSGSKVASSSTSASSSTASSSSASTASETTAPQTQSSSSAQTSTSQTHSSSAGLDITNMYADVLDSKFQSPSRNYTSINNNQTTFAASAGVTFTVDINIDYANCSVSSCPSEISAVSVTPSNFYVESIQVLPPTSGAGLPAAMMLDNNGEETCHFIITITAPSTPYTGPLTVTATPS